MRRSMLALFIGSLALLTAACSDGSDNSNDGNDTASQQVLDRPVMMRDIGFEPGTIEVTRGTKVRLNIQNDGGLMHDFTVDSMPMHGMRMSGGIPGGHAMGANAAMHMALGGGARGMIEFEATEPGDYPFYCTEPGHRDAGMHGILRVR